MGTENASDEERIGVEVVVPATSANLGPGFDCLGLALNLHNRIRAEAKGFTRACAWPDEARIFVSVRGEGEEFFPADRQNLVVRAMAEVFGRAGLFPKELAVFCENDIPSCGGLGSSAAAILGGCLAAQALVVEGKAEFEVLRVATEIEGHPDNIAAAWLGGLTAAAIDDKTGEVVAAGLPIAAEAFQVVLALPAVRLATKTARKSLPEMVPRRDAVFNIQRTALLVAALGAGDGKLLTHAMADRLHQPYRIPLVPALGEVLETAYKAGAYGAAMSGAGPAVIALAHKNAAERVGKAMKDAFARHKMAARWVVTNISRQGATVSRLSPP